MSLLVLQGVCCLLVIAVAVPASLGEVDKNPKRDVNAQTKTVVSYRRKRGIAEGGYFEDCSEARASSSGGGFRPRQKMSHLTRIPNCPRGTYAKPFCYVGEQEGINYQCVPCPIGYYKPKRGPKGCARCGSHQSTVSEEAYYCTTLCHKGRFLVSPGPNKKRNCQACPVGTYMPMKNLNDSCIPCPDGKTTTGSGKSAKRNCIPIPSTATTTPTATTTTTAPPTELPDKTCTLNSECAPLNAFCDQMRRGAGPQKCRCPSNQQVLSTGVCSTTNYPDFGCYQYTGADTGGPGEREKCETTTGRERVFTAGMNDNYGSCGGCWCCIGP